LPIVKFLIEEIKINAKLCMRDPTHSGETEKIPPNMENKGKCFAVLIALEN